MTADMPVAYSSPVMLERRMGYGQHEIPALRGFVVFHKEEVYLIAGHNVSSNRPADVCRSMNALVSPMASRTTSNLRIVDKVSLPDLGLEALDLDGKLAKIRRLTGYKAEEVSALLGCSRQTLHSWSTGATSPSAANQEKVARVLAVLTHIDRGMAEENRNLLDAATPDDGDRLVDLLAAERFDEVKQIAGKGHGREHANWSPVDSRPVGKDLHAQLEASSGEAYEGPRYKPLKTGKPLRLKKA